MEAELEHLDEIICGLVRATLLISGYRYIKVNGGRHVMSKGITVWINDDTALSTH